MAMKCLQVTLLMRMRGIPREECSLLARLTQAVHRLCLPGMHRLCRTLTTRMLRYLLALDRCRMQAQDPSKSGAGGEWSWCGVV